MNHREARMAQIITLKVKSNLAFACLVNRFYVHFIIIDYDVALTQCHVRPKALWILP